MSHKVNQPKFHTDSHINFSNEDYDKALEIIYLEKLIIKYNNLVRELNSENEDKNGQLSELTIIRERVET